ncbi:SDR family oxidoreductase [Actinomadura sp. WAC 06369]|uniref:SDR family oxidoreductase n=1 Tax=Actinomadura sp. WAC 06369 TaxID=2203193 RepID=UPI000F7AE6AA|nr:SDR family oxidoreductase [Actinomadura sp. WAC 06369]RSN72128.1 hypothetical protein DMH08_01100 [Actinomadura sp. WAC 06369]
MDVAVNNAGGAPFTGFASASPRFHRGVTDLNFLAGVFVAQAVHPVMSAQDSGGVVLNVTSISARRPSPGTAVYGAVKAALESVTRSLAVEWAPRIRVDAVRLAAHITGAVLNVDGGGEWPAFLRHAPGTEKPPGSAP